MRHDQAVADAVEAVRAGRTDEALAWALIACAERLDRVCELLHREGRQ